MSLRIVIRPAADQDVIDAAAWLNDQKPGLGEDLLAEVKSAIADAAEHPNRYPIVYSRPDVHRILTRRFHYRVFFGVGEDSIIVYSVLHSARSDRVWRDRL